MKRIFIGLPVGRHVERALEGLQELHPGVRWIPGRNLHITVEFLGDAEADRVEALVSALNGVDVQQFALNPLQLIALPQLRRARVIAVSYGPTEIFGQLSRQVRTAAEMARFVLKPAQISPHLTIARLRRIERVWLGDYLERHQATVIALATLDVDRVNLYESTLSPSGAEYSILSTVELTASRPYPDKHD